MKYQRDNSKVTVTQEMRDQEQKKKEEAAKKEQEFHKKIKDLKEAERLYHEAVEPAYNRENSYPPLSEQLDMLWHDMDAGIIKVDKRKSNTWYKIIKKSKERAPLKKSWKEDIEKAQTKLQMCEIELENDSSKGV